MIWSNFCTKIISLVSGFKKCVSQDDTREVLFSNLRLF
eukprot:UN09280